MQILAKRTIPDSAFNSHCMVFTIQGDDLIEIFQRDKILGRIGNPIEGMTAAEYSQLIATLHDFLYLFNRCGMMQADSTISVIACPIPLDVCHFYIPLVSNTFSTRLLSASTP